METFKENIKLEQFIKELEQNRSLLQSLSKERLEVLNNYYNSQIEEHKQRIEELKKK